MTTFALIHGAGDSGWYWHLVEPALRERGYDVVAPDLPADDSANLQTYADTVIQAIGDRTGVVVVSQSFGAFTAPLVSVPAPVSRERLGIMPDEIDSGHCVALSHPKELADRLGTYVTS